MSFLSELDIVNECLATLGELPLLELDDEHPLTASALNALRVASMREQAKGWWFNKERVTLTPTVGDGHIVLPGDTIRIDPTDESLNYTARGGKLYQNFAAAGVDKYKFTQPVNCWLVRQLPFADLPPTAQDLISTAAVIQFQRNHDGDRTKMEALQGDYRMAYMVLNAEHIRNVNANRLRSPSLVRVMTRIAPSPLLYR